MIHFRERLEERYGIKLSIEELNRLSADMVSGKAGAIVVKRSKNRHVYTALVKIKGTVCLCVWDFRRYEFVTALPREAIHDDGLGYDDLKGDIEQAKQARQRNSKRARKQLKRKLRKKGLNDQAKNHHLSPNRPCHHR